MDVVLEHGFRLLKEIALGHEWVIALVNGSWLITMFIWDALKVGRHFSPIAGCCRPMLKTSKSLLLGISQMLCTLWNIFLFGDMNNIRIEHAQ